MFEDKIQQVRKAETISYTGKIENIVGMSIEDVICAKEVYDRAVEQGLGTELKLYDL